jgi:hypothetical protein
MIVIPYTASGLQANLMQTHRIDRDAIKAVRSRHGWTLPYSFFASMRATFSSMHTLYAPTFPRHVTFHARDPLQNIKSYHP